MQAEARDRVVNLGLYTGISPALGVRSDRFPCGRCSAFGDLDPVCHSFIILSFNIQWNTVVGAGGREVIQTDTVQGNVKGCGSPGWRRTRTTYKTARNPVRSGGECSEERLPHVPRPGSGTEAGVCSSLKIISL